ncbi:MAG: hypothetical protein WC050_00970 [Candidatus Paceibacterota bacterium]
MPLSTHPRPSATRRRLGSAVTILVLIIVFLSFYFLAVNANASHFFSDSLRAEHISRTVVADGVSYFVENGAVSREGAAVTEKEGIRPLALAYAATALERSPQFDIAGTDPELLEKQVDELARVQGRQADSLRIPSNIEFVRTSLYPIKFLRSLVALERSRRAFVKSGADVDLETYLFALDATAAAQRSDGKLFTNAYTFLGFKHTNVPVFGGTMMSDKVLSTLASMDNAAVANAKEAKKQRACFTGNARACNAADLAIQIPPTVSDTHSSYAQQVAQKVVGVLNDASSSRKDTYTVALASSTCVASVEGPYVFRIPDPTRSSRYPTPSATFLGDIFFSTSTIATQRMTNGTVTASVSVLNPMTFYHCSDKGRDVGRAEAVVLTYLFAKAHPSIGFESRPPLLASPTIHEDDAISYLRDALQELPGYTQDERNELISLARMFRNNSARLDLIVNEIWSLNEINLELIKQGFPFDDSLNFLVGTHSGFMSLFQVYNPSVVPSTPEIYDRAPRASDLVNKMQRYSNTMPEYENAIAQYLREFRAFEQRAPRK